MGAAAITITERIRELGLDAEAEDIAAEMLRPLAGPCSVQAAAVNRH